MKTGDSYSLRQVADLTGLSEFTLRGWEGRYNAFIPERTETGRRIYSQKDLQRAFLLRELTQIGHRIGDIAQFSNAELEKKLDRRIMGPELTTDETSETIDSILKLVLLQNWSELTSKVQKLLNKKKPFDALEAIILPLLAKVGTLVANNRISIAQEHILSSLIKEQIYTLLSKTHSKSRSIKNVSFVIATPDGDFHELGILIAHLMLRSYGINSLFLGPNTPKNELCETAIRFGATHILLASTIGVKGGAKEEIFSYLHYLDQHLPKSSQLWLGGRNIQNLKIKLNRNVESINALQDLHLVIKNCMKESRG